MSDPLASIRQWKVAISAGEFHAIIPPRPATDWLELIFTNDLSAVLEADDAERLVDLFAVGAITDEDMQRMIADAVEVASGREWQVAGRLAAAMMLPQMSGEVWSAVDPQVAPLGAVLDVIYASMVRWMKKDDRVQLDAQLNAPPSRTPGAADPREQARRMRELSRERGAASGGPSAARRPRSPELPSPDRQGD